MRVVRLRRQQLFLAKGILKMQKSGTVKWFNDQKGFGFIQPDEGGSDVFVHANAVNRSGMHTLREGQKIMFDIENDPKTRKSSAANLKEAAA